MKILTWNIQATKGCDDRYDADRIVSLIKDYSGLDVICLQEVSKNIPDLNADDQPKIFADQFPGYETIWAPGFSAPSASGKRVEFGNLTLVKSHLLKWARVHSLPSPSIEELQMPRTMAETVVDIEGGQVTIFNTHLAYHSSVERITQLQALTLQRDKIMSNEYLAPAAGAWGPYSYTNKSLGVILCGDLNVGSETAEFKVHLMDQNWIDCWVMQNSSSEGKLAERQPTCGCFDTVQWPQGPHVGDYFLATRDIAEKTQSVMVDVETDASDHQPVLLEIAL